MKKRRITQNELSNKVIRYCSPTLAGLKSGNMFSMPCKNFKDLLCDIRQLNRRLDAKGVKIIPLRHSNERCLLYVFRPSALIGDLADEQARQILRDSGYKSCKPSECIGRLLKRVKFSEEFPHEIGLFLGYPPEDVRGYMMDGGRCPKCTGCWQVYGDESSALAKFEMFRCCTRIFCRMAAMGLSIEELAVAG